MPKRKDPFLRNLGARIRICRERRQWTQEVLAERAELDRSYIAGIEAGLRNPSIKAVSKIARAMGLTLSDLLQTV
ncbi:MAG: helix-turn-helix transcriptional regulator [Cyanobacteria bacterium]|nr:helix-turn-helix transcriptional regulator [Cyanobacteriota bacterium]